MSDNQFEYPYTTPIPIDGSILMWMIRESKMRADMLQEIESDPSLLATYLQRERSHFSALLRAIKHVEIKPE